jgi:hypothetical protein
MTFQFNKKRLPYSGTKLTADQRMARINKMLRDYGITNYQWTTQWDRDIVELKFVIEEENKPFVGIKMVAPLFRVKHSNRSYNPKMGKYEYSSVSEPNWAISLGLFENYLKTKLEAIAFGLRDVREEFMPDILVNDHGVMKTVKDVILPALESQGIQYESLTAGGQEMHPEREIDQE